MKNSLALPPKKTKMSKHSHRTLKPLKRLKRKVSGLWENQSLARVSYAKPVYDLNPTFELKETDEQFVINCELPGVDAKFENGVLTIHIPKNKGGRPP